MSDSDTDAFDMALLGTLDPEELYIQCFDNGPNKIAEKYIIESDIAGMYYAVNVLKRRWKEYENRIIKDNAVDNKSGFLYHYMLQLKEFYIIGRWIEAEKIIIDHPHSSMFYAINILKRRWTECETMLRKHNKYWKLYSQYFNFPGPYQAERLNTPREDLIPILKENDLIGPFFGE